MLTLCSRGIKNASLTSLRGWPMESGVLCVTGAAPWQGSKSVQDVWGRRTAVGWCCVHAPPSPLRGMLINGPVAVQPAARTKPPTPRKWATKGLVLPLDTTDTHSAQRSSPTILAPMRLFPMCPPGTLHELMPTPSPSPHLLGDPAQRSCWEPGTQ